LKDKLFICPVGALSNSKAAILQFTFQLADWQ